MQGWMPGREGQRHRRTLTATGSESSLSLLEEDSCFFGFRRLSFFFFAGFFRRRSFGEASQTGWEEDRIHRIQSEEGWDEDERRRGVMGCVVGRDNMDPEKGETRASHGRKRRRGGEEGLTSASEESSEDVIS